MSYNLEKFLPQKLPMRLLDSIVSVDDRSAVCRAEMTENNLFYDPDIKGVRLWVGVELMAQTAAVYASFQKQEDKPQMGFLMSVRKLFGFKSHFALGDVLTIIAKKEYLEENIGVFQCEIFIDDEKAASAKLNAVLPTDEQTGKILRGEK